MKPSYPIPDFNLSSHIPSLNNILSNTCFSAAMAYTVDAWQRSVLYADVMRQRGNQYQAHQAQPVPNVLDFDAELVMDGRELPRPVNYGLVRIIPPDDLQVIDDTRSAQDRGRLRPFVVVDPRAGHGPGIGGFKHDSEIGAALRAGHPCYFIGFLPEPMPGQTVEDVMRAEAAFLEKVIELHPDSPGKPAVIGNCQAGWQIMMTAAMRPELFGPIIVAGAPMSYWAGWRGKNPMRYSGGLLGGTWMTALTGDLGKGRFDGAWLVQNFENLNPANTLWTKNYNLYANIDTEAPRYLGFEKYWGGHVFLNAGEMQYIADNLFVGNRLTSAELVLSDGTRLDLRNIRSPILVFCSYGDNITPPPQALGWITDLYGTDVDLLERDQTIIYATHANIGHLGIFVSSSTGRKEHSEFVSNIDLIDLLPTGLYEAQIEDKSDPVSNPELVSSHYEMSISRRSVDDIKKIVEPDAESDRRFATAAWLSNQNLGLYRTFVQPWVRASVTPLSSYALTVLHPLRVSYEVWCDRNPLAAVVATQAEQVSATRQPVNADNPFLQMQHMVSDAIRTSLDFYRDKRDEACEKAFEAIYSNPWLQALAGFSPDHDGRVANAKIQPGSTPAEVIHASRERALSQMTAGGLTEACIRALLFVRRSRSEVDERRFTLFRTLTERNILAYKSVIRQQAELLRVDAEAALAALPAMLASTPAAELHVIARDLELLGKELLLDDEERHDLARVLEIFESVAKSKTPRTTRQSRVG
ncbi:DUF3141 domain-containing protein [Neisseriaceae bacterium TC5R-5]|nr:DUF3141 domain-containing protein [Neisseriaceae bacterium TC5R-5]